MSRAVRVAEWVMILSTLMTIWIIGTRILFGWYPVREDAPGRERPWTRPPVPAPLPPAWPKDPPPDPWKVLTTYPAAE